MSTLSVGTVKSISSSPPTIQNTSGTEIGTFCRAWVNFNGTTNVGGFCTIRASFNVSSVADNGVGVYTINFTNAMPDANYSVVATSGLTNNYPVLGLGLPASGNVQIAIANQTASAQTAADATSVFAAIFR